MFRMLIHPSSEACDLFVELFHGLYCSSSMCVGATLWYGWGGVVSVCRLKPEEVWRPELFVDHPPSSSADVKERAAIPLLHLCAFMNVFRVNLTFTFTSTFKNNQIRVNNHVNYVLTYLLHGAESFLRS